MTTTRIKAPPLTPYQQGLFDTHLEDARRLANALYKRYESNRLNHEKDDFHAIANLALIEAVRGYRTGFRTAFKTYFYQRFTGLLSNHYQKQFRTWRKCPTKVISLEAPVSRGFGPDLSPWERTVGGTIAAPSSVESITADASDEVESVTAIAERLPHVTAKRNWAVVLDYYIHGKVAHEIAATHRVHRSRVIQIVHNTVARVREKVLQRA